MFAFRHSIDPGSPQGARVDLAFTDARLDLQGLRPGFADELARVVGETGVGFARMNQVHGDSVIVAVEPDHEAGASLPEADGSVTDRRGLGLMVRVADCVPVLLADADAGVIGVAHAGRRGVELDIVTRVVERMRDLGAGDITAWIGPHICGRCYEVPEAMRAEVAEAVPETYAETSWGTPALDLGAGVEAQLARSGVRAERVVGCTREAETFHSYRRDAADAGRFAGLVWMT